MNVFVLCTGRCGSTTFSEACKYITNYTSGHETNAQYLGEHRLSYPNNHIEVDNRLSWFLGGLEKRFGDNAFYVHLVRNRDATARSLNRRWHTRDSIINAYKSGILMSENVTIDQNHLLYCYDYYDKVNENISQFLVGKSHQLRIELEEWEKKFPEFWEKIGAQGDITTALQTLQEMYNTSNMIAKRNISSSQYLRHWKTKIRRFVNKF